MSGSSENRCIRLEVISGKNLKVPSWREPAGIYVPINVDSQRRWKSAIGVLSSEESVVWGDTVTLSSYASPVLSVEIRASYEADRMLGSGEVIGKLQMSWDELLNHGDEPFDISFPPVRGVHPSLTLKAAVVQACDDQDGYCEMIQRTDAGHAQFAEYVASETLVLDQCPANQPDYAAALTNLAWARLVGYIQNHLQDIDTTISLFRNALALRPQRHPDHPLSLYILALALSWRHIKKSTAADIREAAQLYHELLPLCPGGTYLRSIATGRFDYVIGGCNNLPTDASDEGICLRRFVLELCPVGHQHRPRALNELSMALVLRFTQNGNIDDLGESIQFLREAVSLCPEGHTDRDGLLTSLAVSLGIHRFRHQGNPIDLDEAISLHEEALRLRPVGHEFRDTSLDNLGRALTTRFIKRGARDDITRAINHYREALTLCPPGHPRRDTTLSNLAFALKTRYNKLDVSEDLNEAIDLHRESLRIMRLDHPKRHETLFHLSSALYSHSKHTRKKEDVKEAMDILRKSVEAVPSLRPDMYYCYMWKAETYLTSYRMQLNPADLSLAIQNLRLASRLPTKGFPDRIQAALRWLAAAESHQHDSALEAYQVCFELFDNHVMTRSSIIARREAATAFRHARSLPVDAASCAIRRGNLPRAVELMEQGRGQQWSLVSRLRTPLEDLESTSPELARKVSELNKCLAGAQGSAGSTDRAAVDLAATKQWESAVADIRNLQGFSRFLLSSAYDDLHAAARHGPVIILIASQYSCSAIVVPTSGEPHHVPLQSISLADLMILKDRFTRAIRHASRMSPKETRTDLIVLLRIVWEEIMLPIVNVLDNILKVKRRSRIWLCPTAAFTSIPLHAANPFLTKADHSKEPCLEDLYICSYTPTLSALVRSRKMTKKRADPSFVAIGQGQPGAGKGKALLAVDSELELVRELVPATASRTTISGDAATRAGALEALEANTWVHLACHGKQDSDQPYHSHFVMRDEHLTLLDIMERDIPHAEFAFLSACHTAVGDKKTPDEVIHLAAGLQFSGFKSVVGTLWEVDDSVAKHVVEAFYKYMFHLKEEGIMDCTKAAWALNCATHAVKTKVPLEQRMVFVHIVISKISKYLFASVLGLFG
ncbi:CHAT domain-containing protein [Suillus occidentalis]|nr:CHAT domain-containing protein [Suillus occidentalis]